MCMEFVMYSITANTVIALVIPLFTPNKVEFTETGDLKTESEGGKNPFSSPVMMTIFTVLRYVLFLGLYVGFGGVLVAVFRFKPPAGVWEGEIPDVSPAVALRSEVNSELNFPPNFEGLVLGCIDADFCK